MSKSGTFKPNKGVLKRLRITAKGRFKRLQAGKSHLCSHKSGSRVRKLRKTTVVPKCEERRLRRMVGLRVSG